MTDCEDECFDTSTDEWVKMVNDQSFLEFLDQSEWDVDLALFEDESVYDALNDESAYQEFLESVIGNINI